MGFLRSEALPGVEVLHMKTSGTLPPRRTSGSFIIETMVEGELDEYYQRGVHRLTPGQAYLINAEEIFGPVRRHTPTVELVAVLLEPSMLVHAARGLLGHDVLTPCFRRFVASDPALATHVRALAQSVTEGAALPIQEARLAVLLQGLVASECQPTPLPNAIPTKADNIRRVRDYLRDRFAEKISLEDLEGVSGLSRFHLLRRFRAEVGVPPHTYQVIVRVERAREFIRRGMPPVNVASVVGFADQSHLTRHFKRRVGMTPGAYARRIVGAGTATAALAT